MSFELTAEQEMLQESVERFVTQSYDLQTHRRLAESTRGFSDENWKTFAELGWLSVPFAEENEGFGGSMVDIITITRALGGALVTEPFVASLILGGRIVELLGDDARKQALLPPLISGELHLALAHAERHSAGNPACVGCRVERDGEHYILTGDKIMVLNGAAADHLIVTARSSGAERDRAGIEVFVVDADAEGITRRDYPTIGGMHAADIRFDGVRVPAAARMGDPDANLHVLETVIDEAIVAFSAEAVGAMAVLHHDTVEYAKARTQFGRPIARFQALQFRMVDMWLAHQQCVSALHMAAQNQSEGGAVARRSASALKVVVSRASRFIGEQAIQIHAGIGTSDELRVGHYFKRLLCIDALLGSSDYHLDRYATLMDGEAPDVAPTGGRP